jgi:hypothetical protein
MWPVGHRWAANVPPDTCDPTISVKEVFCVFVLDSSYSDDVLMRVQRRRGEDAMADTLFSGVVKRSAGIGV